MAISRVSPSSWSPAGVPLVGPTGTFQRITLGEGTTGMLVQPRSKRQLAWRDRSRFLEAPGVPGLVPLLARQEASNTFAYVIEEGQLLSEIMLACVERGVKPGVRPAAELVAGLAPRLAQAIDAARRHGASGHGNLTPWHIVVHPDGRLGVIGYGLTDSRVDGVVGPGPTCARSAPSPPSWPWGSLRVICRMPPRRSTGRGDARGPWMRCSRPGGAPGPPRMSATKPFGCDAGPSDSCSVWVATRSMACRGETWRRRSRCSRCQRRPGGAPPAGHDPRENREVGTGHGGATPTGGASGGCTSHHRASMARRARAVAGVSRRLRPGSSPGRGRDPRDSTVSVRRVLEYLTGRTLLRPTLMVEDGPRRWEVVAPVRAALLEQLEAGVPSAAQRRHAAHFHALGRSLARGPARASCAAATAP